MRLFRKVIQSAGQLNTFFPYVRTFGPGANVCIFNFEIYQCLDGHDEKRVTLEKTHRLDREKPIWKAF